MKKELITKCVYYTLTHHANKTENYSLNGCVEYST